MAEARRCAFIEERACNFPADQISMDFCRVCIDAYKASGGAKSSPPASDKAAERLARLDALFQRGELEPEDYIRLRRGLLGEAPAPDAKPAARPARKGFHLLLVDRGLFSKKVRTYPAGWSLPSTITGRLVESLYSMCDSAERATDVRLEVGETRIACLGRDGGRLALIVTEDDLSEYPQLIASVGAELERSEDWEGLLGVASSGQG